MMTGSRLSVLCLKACDPIGPVMNACRYTINHEACAQLLVLPLCLRTNCHTKDRNSANNQRTVIPVLVPYTCCVAIYLNDAAGRAGKAK